jgi:hypothetical protein
MHTGALLITLLVGGERDRLGYNQAADTNCANSDVFYGTDIS